MDKEIWKDIPDYDGIYQVSSLGRVKSLKFFKQRILKQSNASNGYLTVGLSKGGEVKTKFIHQLVAITFLNHEPNYHQLVIDHIDFNRENNNYSNLRIVTTRENTSLKHKKSLSKYTGVRKDKRYSTWQARITVDGKRLYLGSFQTELEAHEAYKNKLNKIT